MATTPPGAGSEFGHERAFAEPASMAELRRLRSLYTLDLLEGHSGRFDRFSRIAAQAFAAPVALVTVLDDEHQWFCSAVGTDLDGNVRSESFCTRLVDDDSAMLVVEDTLADNRFAKLPIVDGPPHIRFYAGASISSTDGERVGSLCILDVEPRSFGTDQQQMLRDLGDLVESEIHHLTLALTDELTKLSNRRAFIAAGKRYLALAARRSEPVTIVFGDVDGLKAANDGLGHAHGDTLLRQAADALRVGSRTVDLIARIGGDEFAIVMYGVDAAAATGATNRLSDAVAASNAGHSHNLAMSFGTATSASGATLEELLSQADVHMYEGRRIRLANEPW